VNSIEQMTILQLVYSEVATSRASLSETTKLARSSITLLVRDLQARGLVQEVGRAPSQGGRRRVLLRVRPDLAHLAGVRIGRWNMRIVTSDLLGKILSLKTIPTQVEKGERHVFELIERELDAALKGDRLIKGIGIATSGVIDRDSGTVFFWPKVPGWNDVPLRKRIHDKYGLPVIVEDTVRTMALAEQRFGEAKGFRNFVYVLVSMGIGAAIFMNGQLCLGGDNMAGEFGHITIDERGDICSCGNRGCLEVYASGGAIINRSRNGLQQGVYSSLAQTVADHPERLSIETIVNAAKSRDQFAQTVLWEAGSHLGTGVATIVNLLNPEAIFLGGEVARSARSLLLKPMFHSLRTRTFHRSVRNLKLVVSRLGGEAGAVGAAVLAGEKLLPSLLHEARG
jgi:predicted NBD/HSP70 family sugar kinase